MLFLHSRCDTLTAWYCNPSPDCIIWATAHFGLSQAGPALPSSPPSPTQTHLMTKIASLRLPTQINFSFHVPTKWIDSQHQDRAPSTGCDKKNNYFRSHFVVLFVIIIVMTITVIIILKNALKSTKEMQCCFPVWRGGDGLDRAATSKAPPSFLPPTSPLLPISPHFSPHLTISPRSPHIPFPPWWVATSDGRHSSGWTQDMHQINRTPIYR